ncbi:NitT/TauT family transport system substrate-binding protein [Actinacidiphila guanduensis]|uniref:NitT/TauT family transport system substrate-binding protein n=1 Tax=Actinacidiphila guanduensis TaxID=310781 RepID=A0A1H0KDK6_9ACTN|nr:aliphatic sulfonate ABC transporter substrate-binding protein [Actinacidiphila guanduensis]SDO53802.1 NitT/TauT family transport system substrate-binding protein [Actinacidiphila guanduensis]
MSALPRTGSRIRPHRRRLTAAAVALPILFGALAACGYGSDKSDDAKASTAPAATTAAGAKKLSADQVRIGFFPNLTHATPLVGLKEGFFQQELGGTTIKQATFNAGPAEIEALNAGSIDIGWIGPSPAINGYTKSDGKSLRIISGSASGGVKLVVNPKKIKTLADVKGKKIATPQLGNTQDVALLNWIKSRGWKVDAQSGKGDVSVIRTDNSITPQAYKNGSIDGAWVPEPTASKLVDEGAKVLLDESTLWPNKQFVITNVIVSQKFLTAHPDVVEAVLRGSVKTNAWINANPEKAKADANAQLKALTQKALPASQLDPAWQSIKVLDDPLASTAKAEAEHAVAAGLLKSPRLDGIYDLRLLNKVLAEQGDPTVSAAGLGEQ